MATIDVPAPWRVGNWLFDTRRSVLLTRLSREAGSSHLKEMTNSPDFLAEGVIAAPIGEFGGAIARNRPTGALDFLWAPRGPTRSGELAVHFEDAESGLLVRCRFEPLWTRWTYMAVWMAAGPGGLAMLWIVMSLMLGSWQGVSIGALAMLTAVALAYLAAWYARRLGDEDERFLLRFVESALDARPIEGARQ